MICQTHLNSGVRQRRQVEDVCPKGPEEEAYRGHATTGAHFRRAKHHDGDPQRLDRSVLPFLQQFRHSVFLAYTQHSVTASTCICFSRRASEASSGRRYVTAAILTITRLASTWRASLKRWSTFILGRLFTGMHYRPYSFLLQSCLRLPYLICVSVT